MPAVATAVDLRSSPARKGERGSRIGHGDRRPVAAARRLCGAACTSPSPGSSWRWCGRQESGQGHVQPGRPTSRSSTSALELLIAEQESGGPALPPKVKREVGKRDGGRCHVAARGWRSVRRGVRMEVDHVVPRGRGGPSTAENCRVLARPTTGRRRARCTATHTMDLFARRGARSRASPAPPTSYAAPWINASQCDPRGPARRGAPPPTVAARPTHCQPPLPGILPTGGRPAIPSRLPKVAPAQAQARVIGAIPSSERTHRRRRGGRSGSRTGRSSRRCRARAAIGEAGARGPLPVGTPPRRERGTEYTAPRDARPRPAGAFVRSGRPARLRDAPTRSASTKPFQTPYATPTTTVSGHTGRARDRARWRQSSTITATTADPA